MGLSYGEQSLCRVPPSPVHPHEGAPMLFYYNFFIFEAKSLICSLVGAFLWLSRGVASLWCQVCFRSSVVVNLHFSCPNSTSVLSSCYSWYQFTWNCLQLEFSENHWFKVKKQWMCKTPIPLAPLKSPSAKIVGYTAYVTGMCSSRKSRANLMGGGAGGFSWIPEIRNKWQVVASSNVFSGRYSL